MEQMGMLVGNFELILTPKGDHLGVAQGFCDPQRRPIWAWLKQILTPKRDCLKTNKYDMQ